MIERGTVYLLHFSEAYNHARHYVGFTTDLDQRLDEHASSQGAGLLSSWKQGSPSP